MNEANETYRAASAIAAFDAIQVAFAALVKKGILSKAEAEQIIREAIETIKTGGAGDQAAELLAIALEKISKFEDKRRRGLRANTRRSGTSSCRGRERGHLYRLTFPRPNWP